MGWLEPSLAGVAVLVADQVSKRLVLARHNRYPPDARRPLVGIQCVLNRGPALALWAGVPRLIAVWAVAVAAAVMLLLQPLGDVAFGAIGIGMTIGGITGNLVDMTWRRAVVDFIVVGPWPVFNLADAAIVGGLGLMLLALL